MRHHANKALSYLAGTLLFLSVAPAQAQTSSKGRSDKAISMTIPEQPVQTALKQFFKQSGKSCRIAPDLQGTVALTFHDLPFDDALRALLHATRPPPQCDIVDGICLFGVKTPRPGGPQPFTGHISGRVTLGGGRLAAGFKVKAYPWPFLTDHKAWNEVVTDAQGRYAMTVQCVPMVVGSFSSPGGRGSGPGPDGTDFNVSVENGGQPLVEPQPQSVHLDTAPGHTVRGLDFVLQPGPQITVRVHDARTGKPVPDALVQFVSGAVFPGGTEKRGLHPRHAHGGLRFRVGALRGRPSLKVPVCPSRPRRDTRWSGKWT